MIQKRTLIDSHCHLRSLRDKGLDPGACLAEFFEKGGKWLVDVAVDEEGWDERLTWSLGLPTVGHSAGIHPSESQKPESTLLKLEAQLQSPRCWAVGEIGLDWFRGRTQEAKQRDWFRRQLYLAQRAGLPIIIHNREADTEILEDLKEAGWNGEGILHCFSSDLPFARAVLDHGLTLSFAGNVTYPSAGRLREVAAWAPADRLLVETDSPYLAPQAVRGTTNRPVNVGHTGAVVAGTRGISEASFWESMERNFLRVFAVGIARTTG